MEIDTPKYFSFNIGIVLICSLLSTSNALAAIDQFGLSSATTAVNESVVAGTTNTTTQLLTPRDNATTDDQSLKENSGEWIALINDAKPDTKVNIQLNEKLSDSNRSVIEGKLPGYWLITKTDPNGNRYHQFKIPGMGSYDTIGAPDLPLYRFKLAIATDIRSARTSVAILDSKRLTDIRVWPQPIPELDGEKDTGTPEQFRIDRKIYSSTNNWPLNLIAKELPVAKALRNIPAVSAEFSPMSWNPASGDLEIATQFRIVVDHSGAAKKYEPFTQERYQLAEDTFINWHVLQNFSANYLFYTSSFLFVYPTSAYRDELLPLINQKKARGFKVTEIVIDTDIGANTCTDIRNAITSWESSVPFYHDVYALLVGDTDTIPLCTSPTGVLTDDLYASTNGDDLDEEIYLGRLSVDNEGDLANQVNKILAYEDNPNLFCCYSNAVL